mgnify:CR=1 FL=1
MNKILSYITNYIPPIKSTSSRTFSISHIVSTPSTMSTISTIPSDPENVHNPMVQDSMEFFIQQIEHITKKSTSISPYLFVPIPIIKSSPSIPTWIINPYYQAYLNEPNKEICHYILSCHAYIQRVNYYETSLWNICWQRFCQLTRAHPSTLRWKKEKDNFFSFLYPCQISSNEYVCAIGRILNLLQYFEVNDPLFTRENHHLYPDWALQHELNDLIQYYYHEIIKRLPPSIHDKYMNNQTTKTYDMKVKQVLFHNVWMKVKLKYIDTKKIDKIKVQQLLSQTISAL